MKAAKGKPGFTLECDFFSSRLREAIGGDAGLLKQAYALAVAKREAVAQGFRVMEKKLGNGKLQLVLQK